MTKQYNRDLERVRVQLLFQQNGVTQASALVIASLYVYAFKDIVPQNQMIWWCAVFVAVLCVRIFFSIQFIKFFIAGKREFDPIFWERAFVVGVFISGLTWAAAGSFLLPTQSFAHEVMMGFVLAGITSGASVAYSTSLLSAQVFLVSSVLPYIIRLVPIDTNLHHSMAGMTTCYLIIYCVLASRINNYAVSSLKLGFEKDILLNEATKNKERLDEAQKISHVGNTVLGLETNEMFWSDEVFRIFDLEPQSLAPSFDQFCSFIHPEEREDFKNDFKNVMQTGAVVEGDRKIITKLGNSKYIFSRAIAELDRFGRVQKVNGVIFDITERKKTENAIAQSFKMSALGEMAGGMAHEINSPLAAVAMASAQLKELILSDNFEKQRASKVAERIETIAARIAKIIKSLRTFSRNGDSDAFERVEIKSIVNDAMGLFNEKSKLSGVEIICEIPNGLELECRRVQICQVMFNLLTNAFDAVKDLSEKWIRVSIKETIDTFEIFIVDSGSGIKENIQNKIMQPFFTTKEAGKGMGLGLSVSKGIIETHHGRLELDIASTNTSFTITLPKNQAQKKSAA